jgi:hypothetical protein
MSQRKGYDTDCGCCAGVDSETPRRINNIPGKSEISYRVGNYAQFRESLLARLSSSDYPALDALGTREDSDFAIALCDALATGLDVITFYQARLANEHYLRTATEARSVKSMARLVGYVPSPGVAASTYLAFTLLEAPGDSTQSAEAVTIPIGTRVQSVPGPGEKAQSFETVDEATARVEWNSIAPQLSKPWRPAMGDKDLYLEGVSTQMQPGDAILIVGKEREDDETNENWDVRVLATVEPDTDNNRTRVTWTEGLGSYYPYVRPAAIKVKVFALRQRAALFGHNAPDPNMMNVDASTNLKSKIDKGDGTNWKWADYAIDEKNIDLDAVYPKITAGSWLVLVSNRGNYGSPSLPGYSELYQVGAVRQLSRTAFGLSAKITRITPKGENLEAKRFKIPETLVLAQSEELAVLPRVLPEPVYGDLLASDLPVDDLVPDQPIAVGGKRQRIAVAAGVTGLHFSPDEGRTFRLDEGDSLFMLEAPVRTNTSTPQALDPEAFRDALSREGVTLRLKLFDRDGKTGTLTCHSTQIVLDDSRKDDPEVMEIAFIASGLDSVDNGRDRTTLKLSASLANCYERSSARIYGNVVPATHGETVEEILGSGDAGQPDQTFQLQQSPLTFVSAATPSGSASTLELRVNDLLWTEVSTLYGHGGDERIYTIHTDDEGVTTVRFGDGVEGARLPTGRNNVRAVFRKGLGTDGNVAAQKITNLLSRPQGVKSATNPAPADGAENRESLDGARDNAPLSVLTLDRAVSVKDYADFARAFAGIAKAHALWIPAGPARGVFLTIAGIDGATVSESSTTFGDLMAALRSYGDPLVAMHIKNYRSPKFHLKLAVKVLTDYDSEMVLADVEETLRDDFCFDARDFGQGVSEDEVMAVVHSVEGVKAVRVIRLYRCDSGVSDVVEPRLFAAVPVADVSAEPPAAEILTLDDALELGEFS